MPRVPCPGAVNSSARGQLAAHPVATLQGRGSQSGSRGRCVQRTRAQAATAQQAPPAGERGTAAAAAGQAEAAVGSPPAAAAAPAGQDLVVTTFRWPAALGGSEVAVTGSFNGWGAPLPLRRTSPQGDWVRSVALPPGHVQFKYVVDGQWTASPCDQAVMGDTCNNQRLVQPNVVFEWRGGGREVLLTGDFAAWAELLPLQLDIASGVHRLACCLPPGAYSYQFLVDGSWALCADTPTAPTEEGQLANRVEVHAPPAFRLFYATGWEGVVLHARHSYPDGTPASQWEAVPLHSTASRARPKGGSWQTVVLPAQRLPESSSGGNGSSASGPGHHPSGHSAGSSSSSSTEGRHQRQQQQQHHQQPSWLELEFYLGSADGLYEDRPQGGGTYRCRHPGGFKLRSGALRPFPQAARPRIMLVSDLDGTMVGEGPEADAATAELASWWEESPALSGSVLVYNTGRSLGGFLGLLEHKAGALAVPDVLITAVGTKIFRLDAEGGTRGTATGATWQEDLQWGRHLDEGWDLLAVKQVAQAAVDAHQGGAPGEGLAHWLDQGTEHPHRIALSVRADTVAAVKAILREGLAEHGVRARLVVSGQGDWRYLDVLAHRGGKLAALEYVRALYGVDRARCVAAGDSGNDTLMLGGGNPAVVVGNCQPELLDWVLQQPQDARLVVSDAPLARGILEGLARHGLY